MVSNEEQRVLLDCGPDLREQLLSAGVARLDAVIVTHLHGDHCHGIDELRPVAAACGAPVPIFARTEDLDGLGRRFDYAFHQSEFYRPIAAMCPIAADSEIAGFRVRTVDQPHGSTTSLGVRFDKTEKSLVYAIDFSALTDEMATLYQGADVMVGDCLTHQPHPTHMHLDGLLAIARQLKVGHLVLTHMGNGLDYRTLVDDLPDWAEPGFDGLEISL